MAKGIFGNMFDFNGDGSLDFSEQALEFAFLQNVIEGAKEVADVDESDDSITLNFSFGGTDESEDDWRDQYYGNEMELDPDDYDSEEEFQDAYREKEFWIEGISDTIMALADEFGINPVDYDDYDDFLDALKGEMY